MTQTLTPSKEKIQEPIIIPEGMLPSPKSKKGIYKIYSLKYTFLFYDFAHMHFWVFQN